MTDARYSRTDPRAGWIGSKRLDACRECGGELPKRARSFCSEACVHTWKIRSSPSYAASLVLKRDAGVCAECRRDTIALERELRALRSECRKARKLGGGWEVNHGRTYDFELKGDDAFARRIRELGLKGARAYLTQRLWDMDHIVPVKEGGGSCGLDNLRTLCWACHKRVTAELRKRLAAAKRQAEAQPQLPGAE